MIKINSTQLWVHDQDEALAFYTQKLGWEVRSDVTLAEMGDFRWLGGGGRGGGGGDAGGHRRRVGGPPRPARVRRRHEREGRRADGQGRRRHGVPRHRRL